MSAEIRVAAATIGEFVTAALCASGLSNKDASWIAGALVQSNLWGVDSHGVIRLADYVKRFRDGSLNPTPDIQVIHQLPALAIIDGDNGSGYVVGRAAMDRAIELAAPAGIAMVSARHSNHFGAAGIYALQAVRQDMIGIALSNVVPLMTLPGGSTKAIGNNPLAIAVPGDAEAPFIFDTSLSVVANGRIKMAAKAGESIPSGWAVDRSGRATTDPSQATALLPIAGYKGVGLAYAVEILTGVLNGGSFLTQLLNTSSGVSRGISHTMIAINAEALLGPDGIAERMSEFRQLIKSTPMIDGSHEAYLPGERRQLTEQERQEHGIPLPAQLYDELVALDKTLQLRVSIEQL